MWPGGSHRHGNNLLQTAADCQGRQDICKVDSDLLTPAPGRHSNHPDTWTQVRVSDEEEEIWSAPESPDWHWLLYLSQVCPVLWSLQSMQRPVSGSHSSACPLQEQGRQVGKPQWPGRQRSHWRPNAPDTHTHWPVSWSQNGFWEPWGSHAHAAQTETTRLYVTHIILFILRHLALFNLLLVINNIHWFFDYWVVFGLLVDRVLTFAAGGSELKSSWSTSVAVPADHVGATLTLTPVGVTHCAEGALRITLAFWEMELNTGHNSVKHQPSIKKKFPTDPVWECYNWQAAMSENVWRMWRRRNQSSLVEGVKEKQKQWQLTSLRD